MVSFEAYIYIYTYTYIYIYIYVYIYICQNALRAVVEAHSSADTLPKIQAMIVKGKEDLTIKVNVQISAL